MMLAETIVSSVDKLYAAGYARSFEVKVEIPSVMKPTPFTLADLRSKAVHDIEERPDIDMDMFFKPALQALKVLANRRGVSL